MAAFSVIIQHFYTLLQYLSQLNFIVISCVLFSLFIMNLLRVETRLYFTHLAISPKCPASQLMLGELLKISGQKIIKKSKVNHSREYLPKSSKWKNFI